MGKHDDDEEVEVNPWPGGATERQAHVNGLQTELDGLKARADRNPVADATRDRRIKEIGDQLDRFEEKPQNHERETASTGRRGRGGRQTAATS